MIASRSDVIRMRVRADRLHQSATMIGRSMEAVHIVTTNGRRVTTPPSRLAWLPRRVRANQTSWRGEQLARLVPTYALYIIADSSTDLTDEGASLASTSTSSTAQAAAALVAIPPSRWQPSNHCPLRFVN